MAALGNSLTVVRALELNYRVEPSSDVWVGFHMNIMKIDRLLYRSVRSTAVFFLACLLSSCGSSTNKSIKIAETSVPDGAAVFKVPGSDAESVSPVAGKAIAAKPVAVGLDAGDLLPVVFETQTSLNLDYARASVELIRRMNAAFRLPADIDVVFADCGIANAFYVPVQPAPTIDMPEEMEQFEGIVTSAGGAVFMCHELTEQFANFFSDKDQAISTSIFVLMHEIGHALVNQLQLPVLGIEESYVDGMASVFLGEAGLSAGSVLAGWFFGTQPDTPFFALHRAGPQRLGDLACWSVGSDKSLIEDPTIGRISRQLMSTGRNCAVEYQQQREGFRAILGPYMRGEIADFFG